MCACLSLFRRESKEYISVSLKVGVTSVQLGLMCTRIDQFLLKDNMATIDTLNLARPFQFQEKV